MDRRRLGPCGWTAGSTFGWRRLSRQLLWSGDVRPRSLSNEYGLDKPVLKWISRYLGELPQTLVCIDQILLELHQGSWLNVGDVVIKILDIEGYSEALSKIG